MFLADVLGAVVAPVQHPAFDGRTLLLLRVVRPDGGNAGRSLVGIDFVGAGQGDRVLVVDEGSSTRTLVRDEHAPVKSAIVGVVDFVEVGREILYSSEGDRGRRR